MGPPPRVLRQSGGPWADHSIRFFFPFPLPMESVGAHVRLGTSGHRDQPCCPPHPPFPAVSSSLGNRAKKKEKSTPLFYMLLARSRSPVLPGCAPQGDPKGTWGHQGDMGTPRLVWVSPHPQLCVGALSSGPCDARLNGLTVSRDPCGWCSAGSLGRTRAAAPGLGPSPGWIRPAGSSWHQPRAVRHPWVALTVPRRGVGSTGAGVNFNLKELPEAGGPRGKSLELPKPMSPGWGSQETSTLRSGSPEPMSLYSRSPEWRC